ncbi:TPA: DUF4931 domain-containing protein [Candidatus Woesearchaeota archaeon]|nr:DUF4931 domain-containing protein [Candidatus Woesearchaeota archaeon]HII68864.1 DUF4931 domain-containing protein [Candidatus Woesearchaeota archaeon]
MGELRKDYILNRWVIIATERARRPQEFAKAKKRILLSVKDDVLAAGNEDKTPPEIGRIEEGGKWKIRWIPNKFPFVRGEGNPEMVTHNDFYTFSSAFGIHEVIVECPDLKRQLWDLPSDHIRKVLEVYSSRIEELERQKAIRYVVVFKNHGDDAGTSLAHSHSQVAAIGFVPPAIREEADACRSLGGDPYERIIAREKDSERRCLVNSSAIAFCPYASVSPYEIRLLPARFVKRLCALTPDELQGMADILREILVKLKSLNAPYNILVKYAPQGESMRLHLDIVPRLTKWAGFELNSGIIVNPVAPESAAGFYRGE